MAEPSSPKPARSTTSASHAADTMPSCSCASLLCGDCRAVFATMDAALTLFVDFVATLDGSRLTLAQLEAMDRALGMASRIGGDE